MATPRDGLSGWEEETDSEDELLSGMQRNKHPGNHLTGSAVPDGKGEGSPLPPAGPGSTLPRSPSVSPARVGLRKGLMRAKVGW